jgi:hypothetical protein
MARRYNSNETLRRVLIDSDPEDVESDEPSGDESIADNTSVGNGQEDQRSDDRDSDVGEGYISAANNGDASDSDNDSDDESNEPDQHVYTCRNSAEKWSTEAPVAGQTRQQNVVKGKPGPTGFAKQRVSSDNPVESFYVFFNTDMLDLVVRFTNLEGGRVKPDWRDIDRNELMAFIGLIILRGLYKAAGESTRELWGVDGRKDFPETMSYNRFIEIRRFLRFDDRATRDRRQGRDKLAAIRDLWDDFVHNATGAMVPGPFLTVDERLAPFRGRCSFIQYMPAKPAKYGIKMWLCCDAETRYVYNASVYLGKETAAAPRAQNLGKDVVLLLCAPLNCIGRNITTDNFFTSLSLARELLKKRISLVGTVRANRVDVPREFVEHKKRELHSSMFGFNTVDDTALVSYKAKKNKVVVLLSTMHTSKTVNAHEKKKPEIVEFYNKTKGGVDVADQMIECYSTKFATRRWPVVVFCNIVDMCALNAYTLHKALFPSASAASRREFLKTVGKTLCKPCRDARAPPNVELDEARRLAENEASQPPTKRARCHVCPRHRDKKTSQACSSCFKNCCDEHMKIYCETCLG